ncbi:MAG TPA: aminopeptidase [Aminobacterium sp.]|jgi:leucyl aminopeptidase (aminopeptidase T)|uniref:aminopeptidase n=1 Tax=Aminobacterium TaxID=81466 RepID=UPI000EC755CC|nr:MULTISPECIES: aminopeptidase [unclassified Aminobacterium]HCA41033.1 aminopeptidase [Aminobacterium sp.]
MDFGKMVDVSKRLLTDNMGLLKEENLLVICDYKTVNIAQSLFEAGQLLGCESLLVQIQPMKKNGEEPPARVRELMIASDVIVIPTSKSMTHTHAKKNACVAGARIATMPGITEDMYFNGPITADYKEVEFLTKKLTALLDQAKQAEIRKDGCSLTLSLEGRKGVPSTGVYREKGQSGNLPSGEAFIAPVEGSTSGEIIIDGSFAGIGVLEGPLKLFFENGNLVDAQGVDSQKLMELLGENPLARNVAELGIGTNNKARVTGVILEDEKIYGTVHIALGSNDTFGGTVAAGIHVDGVILNPELYLDGECILSHGTIKF